MNNQQLLLTEQQQTSRVAKGYQIFKDGLVEQLNKREFSVTGSRGIRYIVEDLTTDEDIDPVYTCKCPDHEFRKVICGHIIAVQFYQIGL